LEKDKFTGNSAVAIHVEQPLSAVNSKILEFLDVTPISIEVLLGQCLSKQKISCKCSPITVFTIGKFFSLKKKPPPQGGGGEPAFARICAEAFC